MEYFLNLNYLDETFIEYANDNLPYVNKLLLNNNCVLTNSAEMFTDDNVENIVEHIKNVFVKEEVINDDVINAGRLVSFIGYLEFILLKFDSKSKIISDAIYIFRTDFLENRKIKKINYNSKHNTKETTIKILKIFGYVLLYAYFYST